VTCPERSKPGTEPRCGLLHFKKKKFALVLGSGELKKKFRHLRGQGDELRTDIRSENQLRALWAVFYFAMKRSQNGAIRTLQDRFGQGGPKKGAVENSGDLGLNALQGKEHARTTGHERSTGMVVRLDLPSTARRPEKQGAEVNGPGEKN